MTGYSIAPTATRVEERTAAEANDAIRLRDDARIARYEGAEPSRFASRLVELDREWDVERVLQANAGTLALAANVLGFTASPRFFLAPTMVFGFLLMHALHGWCPPVPVFRRMGVRTAREIARERHALKALRGDYDGLEEARALPARERVAAALRAVDA